MATFPRKWGRNCIETIHSVICFLVFLWLDLLDPILCVVYRIIDGFFEGESAYCYCQKGREIEVGDDKVSETLFGRTNVFRETGFNRWARKFDFSEKKGFIRLWRKPIFSRKSENRPCSGNRWSDCGCLSCVSWTQTDDQKLHFVVKEPLPQDHSGASENVLFLHGFMGSSSFWTQTVYQHVTGNCRLFAVDLYGFGKSPKPRKSLYTLRDHVNMIEKSVVLPYKLDSFHVVAHSMGCIIALALAAKHSRIVKSVTLVAPPYFPSIQGGGASLAALNRFARKKLWPPLAFGSAVMSWYEHIGRCVCFVICRHHRIWEKILKLLTGTRDLPFTIMDMTKHTHHSAWHSMHNVICGGAKFTDGYIQTLIDSGVKVCVIQGSRDNVVPLDCSVGLKTKFPVIDFDVVAAADHQTIIFGREKEFVWEMESKWGQCQETTKLEN